MAEIAEDRTLLVLGAGASIGALLYPRESSWRESMAKMPSGDNFFRDMFHYPATDRRGERDINTLGMLYEGLNELIVRGWGLDRNKEHFEPDEWRQINIEEVFTFLHIGEHMYGRGTGYQRAFAQCRESLEQFITSLLSTKADGLHCERLMDVVMELQPTDSIISFNWDTIADFTLQRVQAPQLDSYVDLMRMRPRIRDFVDRGTLLKLHGSLNWFTCANPECRSRGEVKLAARKGKLERFFESWRGKCEECGEPREGPVIIPPTSRKMITRDSTMHRLWMLAREQLGYCQRIVFIGYSFPPTDFYSEWLFRQLYFLEKSRRPDIIVVNPDVLKSSSVTAKRYSSLFRGCTITKFRTLEEFRREGLGLLRRDDI